MKNFLVSLGVIAVIALFTIAINSCNSSTNPAPNGEPRLESLVGTSWKLVGFKNVETGEFVEAATFINENSSAMEISRLR